MSINIALKVAILESGYSQTEIAKAADLHESTLSRIIRGHDEATKVQKKVLARLLRRRIAELFPPEREAVA